MNYCRLIPRRDHAEIVEKFFGMLIESATMLGAQVFHNSSRITVIRRRQSPRQCRRPLGDSIWRLHTICKNMRGASTHSIHQLPSCLPIWTGVRHRILFAWSLRSVHKQRPDPLPHVFGLRWRSKIGSQGVFPGTPGPEAFADNSMETHAQGS